MVGQQVGCPHCQSSILIQMQKPDLESLPPTIVTDRPVSRTKKKKKSAPKSKAPTPEALKDLYAPGFKGKPKPAKPDLPDKEKDKSPSADPQAPAFENDPGTANEKKRWRSPKKLPPTTQPKPTSNTPSPPPPVAPEQESVPKKPLKPKFREPPTRPAASKTKRLAIDATTELDDHPDEASDNRPAVTRSDVVDVKAVEATLVEKPTEEKEIAVDQIDQGEILVPDAAEEKPTERVVTGEPPKEADEVGAEIAVEAGLDANRPEPIDHLLPPRFDVLDPSRMRAKAEKNQFKVLLPDGKGGMAQVDQRVVRVEHEGERVSLVVMTPEQRSRRRLIQNIIAIIIGIALMALAFSMLT